MRAGNSMSLLAADRTFHVITRCSMLGVDAEDVALQAGATVVLSSREAYVRNDHFVGPLTAGSLVSATVDALPRMVQVTDFIGQLSAAPLSSLLLAGFVCFAKPDMESSTGKQVIAVTSDELVVDLQEVTAVWDVFPVAGQNRLRIIRQR